MRFQLLGENLLSLPQTGRCDEETLTTILSTGPFRSSRHRGLWKDDPLIQSPPARSPGRPGLSTFGHSRACIV